MLSATTAQEPYRASECVGLLHQQSSQRLHHVTSFTWPAVTSTLLLGTCSRCGARQSNLSGAGAPQISEPWQAIRAKYPDRPSWHLTLREDYRIDRVDYAVRTRNVGGYYFRAVDRDAVRRVDMHRCSTGGLGIDLLAGKIA